MNKKEDYNSIPVFYCLNCLSLKIRSVVHLDSSEYCDECGSTNVSSSTVDEWEKLYIARYGHKFLEDKY